MEHKIIPKGLPLSIEEQAGRLHHGIDSLLESLVCFRNLFHEKPAHSQH
jgi:hypothetical protein